PTGGADPLVVLSAVAGCEAQSEHPIGQALRAYAAACGARPQAPSVFRAVAGAGVVAELDGQKVVIGNRRLLIEQGIAPPSAEEEERAAAGRSAIYVAMGTAPCGVFFIGDRVREHAPGAIRRLESLGVGVALVTGDTRPSAERAATELGI